MEVFPSVCRRGIQRSESSPRPWRCFCNARTRKCTRVVFSTSVEVFLGAPAVPVSDVRLLHVRGGVSIDKTTEREFVGSSPRPWRCFQGTSRLSNVDSVFSTSVEVFPRLRSDQRKEVGFLHVRGGVSSAGFSVEGPDESSPRPWRCFPIVGRAHAVLDVFSTSVEVFLKLDFETVLNLRLLHVRGGVS